MTGSEQRGGTAACPPGAAEPRGRAGMGGEQGVKRRVDVETRAALTHPAHVTPLGDI